MTDHNIYFYIDNCPLCSSTLEQVGPFFTERGLPLLVKRLPKDMAHLITGVPAVFLRKETFKTAQEIIILGSNMLEQLKVLDAAKL